MMISIWIRSFTRSWIQCRTFCSCVVIVKCKYCKNVNVTRKYNDNPKSETKNRKQRRAAAKPAACHIIVHIHSDIHNKSMMREYLHQFYAHLFADAPVLPLCFISGNENIDSDSNAEDMVTRLSGCTSEFDTRCYFNVRSKADISQLNPPHSTNN